MRRVDDLIDPTACAADADARTRFMVLTCLAVCFFGHLFWAVALRSAHRTVDPDGVRSLRAITLPVLGTAAVLSVLLTVGVGTGMVLAVVIAFLAQHAMAAVVVEGRGTVAALLLSVREPARRGLIKTDGAGGETPSQKLPLREVLQRLKTVGMGSLPGGGGEILVDRVRKAITANKCLTEEWLDVHRVWHQLGGRSTCTMMFGHVETPAERIEHLDRLRQLQNETHGFTAFICWTFQAENTKLRAPTVGAHDYLRTQALGRIYLDNFENIQSSWVTQGLKTCQLGLRFGGNDVGSIMIEENVVSAAGTTHRTTTDELVHLIRSAGKIPVQRDTLYRDVKVFD